jgi:hypothetical protein
MNIPAATIRSQQDTANLARFRIRGKLERLHSKQKSKENLANGVFQPLPPVLFRDIGNQPILRGVYRRFSVTNAGR